MLWTWRVPERSQQALDVTVRSDVRWRNRFFHLAQRRGRKIAKVAMARRLGIRLYWMWRRGWNYEQLESFGSHAGQPGHGHGVQSITDVMIERPAPLH
jgi:transposase